MLKNLSRLEHKVGDKVYHLFCDQDSPLNEVKEALFEFLKFVGKIEDTVKAQQESINAEAAKESKVEELVEPKAE